MLSLCAEMAATCCFSFLLTTGREIFLSASTAIPTARSNPRLISTALAPAVTLRTPSAKMACARMVDVLVPSPTASPVRSAASRIICAPRFSSRSSTSNSFAMVTPSLQTSGLPHFFSIKTHFDFGPSVTRTASGEGARAAQYFFACLGMKTDLFVWHKIFFR